MHHSFYSMMLVHRVTDEQVMTLFFSKMLQTVTQYVKTLKQIFFVVESIIDLKIEASSLQ